MGPFLIGLGGEEGQRIHHGGSMVLQFLVHVIGTVLGS